MTTDPRYFRNKPDLLIETAERDGAFIMDNPDGTTDLLYWPQPKQQLYHASTVPNLIMEGRRGTGKSLAIRWDFHMRALAYPGYTYLILRRTMPELRKSHLLFIGQEMKRFTPIYGDSVWLKGVSEAHYGNGSIGLFGHCETEADIQKYLSAQFCAIAFDEITTFDWDMITRISSSCRVEEGSGLIAIVRGGTNPLGVSAEDVYRYFIDKSVTPEEDAEYNPNDWGSIRLNVEDNRYLDVKQYDKRFAGLPLAYQDAWKHGKWGVEGAYFKLEEHHGITTLPTVRVAGEDVPMLDCPWLHVYRIVDWGFGAADPAVCLWVAVLPNRRKIPFMEMMWTGVPASEVAKQIHEASDGMRVITTLGDPTMWDGLEAMGHCLADEFENNKVSMTKAKNDRTAAGYAIQNALSTILDDGLPELQIWNGGGVKGRGCVTLDKTLRSMRVDKKRPGRIADHKQDHFPICLGYLCMAGVGPTIIPTNPTTRRWMQPKKSAHRVLGSNAVRHAIAR